MTSTTAWGRMTLAAMIVAITTACSVTDYQQPVANFAKATQDAEEALTDLNQLVTDAYADVIFRRVLDDELLVLVPGDSCRVVSERCLPVVVDQAGNTNLLTPKAALRNMIILMRAIGIYVNGLSAIVNADTATKVTSSVNSTLGSAENLAKTVDKLSGNEVAATIVAEYATPAGTAVNWIVGQYVAKVQVDGLRRATIAANPAIAAAASLFSDVAEIASTVPNTDLANKVTASETAFEDNHSKATLEQLIISAANYDRFLLAQPSSVMTQLKNAHQSLADKLQNDDLSMADVMAKINSFSMEAETLVAILKELKAAGDNS